jgi:hypothetical protein
MNSFIILEDGLSLSIDMKPYLVDKSHPNYTKILDAIKAEDWDVVPELANIAKALTTFGYGNVQVDADNGVVVYNGEEMHGSLTDRMLQMMREGFTVSPLVAFLDNLMENPSKRAVDELYGFLEHGKMPITEDGHFLAYKRVNDDYTSVHDSKTDNSIGSVVSMERNKVDDNKDRTCSYGLHFCSHEYLSSFSGARVVVLKVNPRDVVSIPTDYNDTKGRACEYEVIGELSPEEVEKAMRGSFWDESVNTDYNDADREIDELEVSNSFLAGYERGRQDGRAGTSRDSAVVVMELVANTDEYIEGYECGHKDGKGHKPRPNFRVEVYTEAPVPTDEDTFTPTDEDFGW